MVSAFDYDAWFRTICGENDFSEWSGPYYVPTFSESLPARAMISPNPTKGMIQIIDFNANNVEIYNSSGVLVLTQNVNNNQVDLSSLKAGQYILNFTDENKNQTSVHVMKK